MVEIKSILKQSDQGVTRPFICQDVAGAQLWVKGPASRVSDLAAEWVCGELAKAWGLPVADFTLVEIADELIQFSAIPSIASLGAGVGFGSYHVSGAEELDVGDFSKIFTEVMADVLLFDSE